MTFRSYLLFMLTGTIISFGAWVFIMTNVNPFDASTTDFILFYLTLSFALVGLLALVGVLWRVRVLGRSSVISREVKIAFRHAILLSFVAIVSLILLNQLVFHWWTLFLLIGISSLIELLALKIQQSGRG